MLFTKLNGKKVSKNVNKYIIDWDAPERSQFQLRVKQYLKQFWFYNVCYSELPVVGTRMTIDLFNATKRIAVESDGAQHYEFSEHWHKGSRANYLGQIKRDILKEKWCEINNIKLIRIFETDVLSRQFFIDRFDILL